MLYWAVSLGGFHLFPTLAVFAGLIPAWYVLSADGSTVSFGVVLGAAISLAGTMLEGIADDQLHAFRQRRTDPDQILAEGVWAWCRHPNYFGNALLWLGVGVLALAGGSPWWTAAGPAVMWFLLLKVSGVSMLERTIVDRRPEYRRYIEEVPAFFPNPFSRR